MHYTYWPTYDMAYSHGHNYNYEDTEVWTLVVVEGFADFFLRVQTYCTTLEIMLKEDHHLLIHYSLVSLY